jgi:fibronectin type 3 domain-containing protein
MPNQFFTARRIYYYLEAVDLSGNLQSDGTAETPHEVIVYLVQPYKDGYVVDRKKRSNGDYEREATVNVGTLKGYKKGQVFTVFTADERVVDPESGMVLAIRQKVTGKVEITKAGPASSTVRITDEEDRNVPIEAGQLIRFRPGPPRNVGGRSEKYQENIVTWDVASEPEVRGYYVYRSDSPDGPFEEFDQIRSRSRAEAKDKGGKKSKLVEGERYYYKVVSFNDEKELSDYSAIGSVVAKGGPNPPTSVTAISGEIQKISLFWTPTDDNEAVGYKIQRAATQEGPYIDIAELKSNRADEYSDKPRDSQNHPLDDATSYWYQIVSYNRSGKIGNPTEPVMAVSRRKPTAPEQLAVVSSSVRSITLTWEPAADQDVERYRIYRSASTAGPWTPIKEIRDRNEGEFADEDRSGHDLQDGATYYYRIASVNEGGVESPLSEPVSGTTFGPPAGPTDVFALSGQVRQVTVTWGLSTDPSVAGYAIYRGNSSDSLEKVKSITQGNVTSYVDKGDWSTRLEDGRSYFYAIRSVNGVGVESVEPKVIEAMTKPGPNPPPNVTATQHEAGRTTISWDNQPSAGIESYRVLRSDNPDADYRTVAPAVKQVTFTDSGLKNGALYYYKVQALDKDGLLGSLSRVVTAQTKAAPTMPEGITSSPDGGAVILTWTASSAPDIDKYEIYQISFFGKKKLGETSDATFTVTGLSSGSTNTFTIVAIDREGLISEPSAPIEVLAP